MDLFTRLMSTKGLHVKGWGKEDGPSRAEDLRRCSLKKIYVGGESQGWVDGLGPETVKEERSARGNGPMFL